MALTMNTNRIKGLHNCKEKIETLGGKYLYVRKSNPDKELVQGYCYKVCYYDALKIILYPTTLLGVYREIDNFYGDACENYVKVGFE